MENSNALSKLRPGLPKCYTYSEPEDESSDELETSKDGKVKPKPKVVKRIRKKRGRKKRYHPIIDDIRQELIDAVNNKGEKIKEAAERLQINYSSAKSIFQVFKKEGRLNRKVLIRKPLFSQDQTLPKKQEISQENKSPASIQGNLIEVVDNTVETQNTQVSNPDQDDSVQLKQPVDLSKYNYSSQFFPPNFGNKHIMDHSFIQNIGVPIQAAAKNNNINYPRHPMQGPFGTSVGLFDMNNPSNMYFTPPSAGIQDFKNRNPAINPNVFYNAFSNYQQQPNFAQNWNWSKASPNPFMASYYSSNPNFYNQNIPDHRAPNMFLLNANNSSAAVEDQVALKEEFDGVKTEHTGFSTKIENFDNSSQV